MSPLFAELPPFSSSSGGPSLVVVIHSHHPRPTRRPPTRTGCQQNVALPPAHASPLSAGCDAIRPPRCCHCRHRAAISAVVRPRYPSGADHRQARQRVRHHRHHQHRPLPLLPAAGHRTVRPWTYGVSCSSHLMLSLLASLSPPPPGRRGRRNNVSSSQTSSQASPPTSHAAMAPGYVALVVDVDDKRVKVTMVNY